MEPLEHMQLMSDDLGWRTRGSISMRREQLIVVASCLKAQRSQGCDARPGLMTYST
jgi:hypothetical protein